MDEDAQLRELIAKTDARCRSNSHRIDDLESNQKAVTELALSVQAMATEQSNMKDDLFEMKTDVKTLAQKAGRRFDSLVDKALWLVCGGLLSLLLSRIGL